MYDFFYCGSIDSAPADNGSCDHGSPRKTASTETGSTSRHGSRPLSLSPMSQTGPTPAQPESSGLTNKVWKGIWEGGWWVLPSFVLAHLYAWVRARKVHICCRVTLLHTRGRYLDRSTSADDTRPCQNSEAGVRSSRFMEYSVEFRSRLRVSTVFITPDRSVSCLVLLAELKLLSSCGWQTGCHTANSC